MFFREELDILQPNRIVGFQAADWKPEQISFATVQH